MSHPPQSQGDTFKPGLALASEGLLCARVGEAGVSPGSPGAGQSGPSPTPHPTTPQSKPAKQEHRARVWAPGWNWAALHSASFPPRHPEQALAPVHSEGPKKCGEALPHPVTSHDSPVRSTAGQARLPPHDQASHPGEKATARKLKILFGL